MVLGLVCARARTLTHLVRTYYQRFQNQPYPFSISNGLETAETNRKSFSPTEENRFLKRERQNSI